MKIKFVVILLMMILSKDLFSQNIQSDSLNNKNIPLNEIYLGYGAVNGGRLGYRLCFNKDMSGEFSIGKNFLFNEGLNKYYFTAGVNVYSQKYDGLFFSMLAVYEKTNDSYGSVMAFSPNVGYFQIKPDKHLSLHLRAGPVFYSKQRGDSYSLFGLNIDVSLGINF